MRLGPYDEPPTEGDGEVVLALPPLAMALPLAWDRYVRNRLRHPYETWLEAVLSEPPADWPTVRSFWEHHHYDVLVDRWRTAVGDRLVVVAASPDDGPQTLSASAAEVLRRVNVAFHHREWSAQRYDQVVRRGVVSALSRRSDSTGADGLVTPGWAIQRANAIAAADLARLESTGVQLAGDLAALARVPAPRAHATGDLEPLTLDAAADALVSVVEAVAEAWPR